MGGNMGWLGQGLRYLLTPECTADQIHLPGTPISMTPRLPIHPEVGWMGFGKWAVWFSLSIALSLVLGQLH